MTDLKNLAERIDEAIRRITSGDAPMRIPAEQTDPDLVLRDCQNAIHALQQEVETLRGELARAKNTNKYYETVLYFPGIRPYAVENGDVAVEISPQKVAEIIKKSARARQGALEEAANAARTLVQSGVTPDGIYHTIRALQQHTGEVSGYVRVPREPTREMLWALCINDIDCQKCPSTVQTHYGPGTAMCLVTAKDMYKAMLATLEDRETKP